MPSPAWEDLDDFLDPEEFAVPCVITFQAGGVRAINVIFDDPYVNAQAGEYSRDDRLPHATAKEADLVGVRRKDSCVIGGQVYDVMTGAKPDGTGLSVLELSLRVASES